MIDTILVATDGSDQARKAVDLAGDLALGYGAGVNLVLVLPPCESESRGGAIETVVGQQGSEPLGPGAGLSDPRSQGERAPPDRIRRKVAARLLSSAEQALREQGLRDITTSLLDGEPAGAIVARSREIGADMIVLGRRALGELEGLETGSVSHRVASLAPCTCVTVT